MYIDFDKESVARYKGFRKETISCNCLHSKSVKHFFQHNIVIGKHLNSLAKINSSLEHHVRWIPFYLYIQQQSQNPRSIFLSTSTCASSNRHFYIPYGRLLTSSWLWTSRRPFSVFCKRYKTYIIIHYWYWIY